MTNKTYGMFLYGLRDIKITNDADTVQADLNAAVTFTFKPGTNRIIIEGDDVVKKDWATVKGGEGTLSAGAYSSDAMAIMLGKTLVVAGSSPNETATMDISEGDVLPPFKIYGMATGPDGDATQVLLGNCRLIEVPEYRMQNQTAYTKDISVSVIGDANGRIARFIQKQTAGTLPAAGAYPTS